MFLKLFNIEKKKLFFEINLKNFKSNLTWILKNEGCKGLKLVYYKSKYLKFENFFLQKYKNSLILNKINIYKFFILKLINFKFYKKKMFFRNKNIKISCNCNFSFKIN